MSTARRNGRSRAQTEALDRFFKGLPVKEAEESLLLIASSQDIRGAVQGDPERCVYARACKRLFNSSAALFFRTRAYIDLPDIKGKRTVRRYWLTPEVREAIIEFDRTGTFPPGGFKLRPFPPSQQLDKARKSGKRRREAILKGERKRAHGAKQSKRDDILALEGARSGQGMVHFSRKAA